MCEIVPIHTVSLGTREVGAAVKISITCACQQTQIMDGENVMKSEIKAWIRLALAPSGLTG